MVHSALLALLSCGQAAVRADQVASFSIANPLAPTLTQNISLGAPMGLCPPERRNPTSIQLPRLISRRIRPALSSTVVNHSTCLTNNVDAVNCPQGNAIHFLKINQADGTLTEQPGSRISSRRPWCPRTLAPKVS